MRMLSFPLVEITNKNIKSVTASFSKETVFIKAKNPLNDMHKAFWILFVYRLKFRTLQRPLVERELSHDENHLMIEFVITVYDKRIQT